MAGKGKTTMFPETLAAFLSLPVIYGIVQAVILERLGWFQSLSSGGKFAVNGILTVVISTALAAISYFVPADVLTQFEPYYVALRPILLLLFPALGFVATWAGHAADKRMLPVRAKNPYAGALAQGREGRDR